MPVHGSDGCWHGAGPSKEGGGSKCPARPRGEWRAVGEEVREQGQGEMGGLS